MKTIIVTGSTGGIGRSTCRILAKSGYRLILTARNVNRLKALHSEICLEAPDADHSYFSLDLSDISHLDNFCASSFGEVHGIVLMPPQLDPSDDPFATPEQWMNMFSTSFVGPSLFLKKFIPNLKRVKRSKVVLISGISSLQVLSHYATSNVLRCAWVGMTKTLAHSLGKDGVHVNTLSLGGVLTPEYLSELSHEAQTTGFTVNEILLRETSNVPLRKYASPEDIGFAIEAMLGAFTDHLTGVNIAVDGGFTRSY